MGAWVPCERYAGNVGKSVEHVGNRNWKGLAKVDDHPHVQVGHQVVGNEEKRVDVYRAKIKEDFDGAVFGSKVPKDPPVRGLVGEARIDLKEGATPVR
jgi:hypothetical protein